MTNRANALAKALANGYAVSQQIADMIKEQADNARSEYPEGTTATGAALEFDEERKRK